MHLKNIFRSLGLLVIAYSHTMIPPFLVALWYREEKYSIFLISYFFLLLVGICFWHPIKAHKQDPYIRDSFLLVVLFWLTAGIVGSLPFMLSQNPDIPWIDAIFESFSGITATGATILTGLDNIPRSILYYRQQLQFLGGLSVILLAVAILPALGIGGLQIIKAEMTGPMREDRLTPRIAQSARGIWMIYCGLALFCAIGYWACGMSLFDATCYSFATISTGGFATHDQNFAYFTNPTTQIVAIVFMILGGINFSLHFITTHYGGLSHYWKNQEFKSYLFILIVATLTVVLTLDHFNTFNKLSTATIESMFQVISISTTTGFTSSNFSQWPVFLPILLLLLGVVGGCSGSTSGGIKIIRILLLHKQGIRELHRLIHPNATYTIKFGTQPLNDRIINAIWGFLATYFALFGLFFLLFLASQLDFISAYSATAAALSNIGPGLGSVSQNYQSMNDFAKILFTIGMVVGRLELFTILVLFTPAYWRY